QPRAGRVRASSAGRPDSSLQTAGGSIMTLQQRWRIGFDIGGTFTDFILYDGEKRSVQLHKRLPTPHDPSEAALIGLEELVAMSGVTLADVSEIVHGTTLVTNVVIERKGAKLGLITTGAFLEFPKPRAPRDLRLEVSERIDRDGHVVTALDQEETRRVLRRLAEDGCEAIAGCLLNAYLHPEHERCIGPLAGA